MRIGLAGVGRIGAFHADDPVRHCPTWTPWSSPTPIPAGPADVAGRLGVEAVEQPGRAVHQRDRRAGDRGGDRRPRAPDRGGGRGRPPDLLREAGRARRRGHPRRAGQGRRRRRAGAHRLPAPLRRRLRRRARRRGVRRARLGAHAAGRHARPGAAAGRSTSRPPAASSATARVHDFDILRWVTGREVVEVYAVGANRGEAFFAELRRRRRRVGPADPTTTRRSAHVAGTRYNARGYDVRLEVLGSQDSISVGLDDRLPLRSVEPGVTFPAGAALPGVHGPVPRRVRRRAHGVHRRGAAAPVPRPAPSPTRSRRSTSPRPASCSRREHRPVLIDEVRR